MDVHPLIFQPIFKPKIWGGRKLEKLLAKRLPKGALIGESWELADLERNESVVAAGPAKGATLGQLVKEWGTSLLGGAELLEGRFPLLIKFLDAAQTLSIQVHPDEAAVLRVGGRVRAKNEAWYVVDADEDGFIYRGLRDGVDADALIRAIEQQRIESVLARIAVKRGHCYYLPAGTIHALGAGVLVAEVQTPSDTVYRLYDWNRRDPSTGAARELHVEQALACVSYDTAPVRAEPPRHVAGVWTTVSSLVRCDSFLIQRIRVIEGVEQQIPHQEMTVWIILEGRGSITCNGLPEPLSFGVGDTVLLPAEIKSGTMRAHADCMWLEVTVPIRSSPGDPRHPDRTSVRGPIEGSGAWLQPDRPGAPDAT